MKRFRDIYYNILELDFFFGAITDFFIGHIFDTAHNFSWSQNFHETIWMHVTINHIWKKVLLQTVHV